MALQNHGVWELVPQEAWPDGEEYVVTGYKVENQLPGAILVQATATAADGILTLADAVFEDRLPDTVHYEEALKIHWTISAPANAEPEGAAEVDAGRSDNELYVLLGVPKLVEDATKSNYRLLWHSLVHLACAKSKGADELTGVLAGIWSQLEVGQNKPGVVRRDGTPLHYYGDWRTPNKGLLALLAHGDSECSGFAILLLSALRVHNLEDGKFALFESVFSAHPLNEQMLIKMWTFDETGSSDWNAWPDASHVNRYKKAETLPHDGLYDSTSYLWADQDTYAWAKQEFTDQNGGAGQNNHNPLASFGNHQVVVIEIGDTEVIYDASYGLIRQTDLAEIQKNAIAGFARVEHTEIPVPFNVYHSIKSLESEIRIMGSAWIWP